MNEKNRFFELEEKEKTIQDEIDSDRRRLEETQQVITGLKRKAETFWEDLKKSVLESQEKNIRDVERLFEQNQKDLKRSEALAEGLKEKIQGKEEILQTTLEEKAQVFAILAEKWLKSEVSRYDEIASKTIRSIRRLLIVHSLLRDFNLQGVYRDTLGGGFEYLPNTKIPILRDFDQRGYLDNASLHGGRTEIETVRSEIISGK